MPNCGVRGSRFVQISLRAVAFITTAAAIYSLGHRLHTVTAVLRLTQPSTLRGIVKCVSAFRQSNNKMAIVDEARPLVSGSMLWLFFDALI